MIAVGSLVLYGGKRWRVGAVGWVGERYYWLVRGNDVAMIPASELEL